MKEGNEIQATLLGMTGQRTVPNIFIKGKHLGGCDATLAAIKSGELKKMLE
jgi:glutaredoxin 3